MSGATGSATVWTTSFGRSHCTLNGRIVDTEAARSLRERPTNPDVADILLRARSVYNRPATPQRQAELVALYERALELDPNSATALAGLAEALLDSISAF